jgi:hypothetical protein
MKYQIVAGGLFELEKFNDEVNRLLEEGWELYGEAKVCSFYQDRLIQGLTFNEAAQ